MSREAERYARLHEALSAARELTGQPLDDYLDTACAGDPELEAELRQMLRAARDHERDDAFADHNVNGVRVDLDALMDGADDSSRKNEPPSWLPEKIDGYTIVRQIGRGGMGVVYEAEQEMPTRRVAIKLLHPIHATGERMRRFRHEAQLLGRFQHPGIAQIFDAGTYDVGRGPQPYFVMELVDGVDIRTYCDRQGLDRDARIELLASVADVIQYAHERRVIHRDLKPDNILVDHDGQVRVLDFGIARSSTRETALSTIATEEGELVGTLAYMAPEQVTQSDEAITSQVDVYALGVLAFEILTGRLPRDIENLPLTEAIALLATSDAPLAGRIDSALDGDPETILGKALDTERTRRYESPGALAEDLRRYLAHEPIHARPPSRVYLVRKFARRNKVLVRGALATVLVAVIGTIVAARFAVIANQRADAMERASYISSIAAASAEIARQDYTAAEASLDRTPVSHRGWEHDYLRARLVHHAEDWETPVPLSSPLTFGERGQLAFAILKGAVIGTWDARSGRLLGTVPIEGANPDADHSGGEVRIHGHARRFAIAAESRNAVLVGSLTTGEVTDVIGLSKNAGARIHAFDAVGARLLLSGDDGVHLWDGTRSRLLIPKDSHRGAFDPSGKRIVISRTGELELYDIATAERIATGRVEDALQALEFSPDGRRIAAAGHYRNVFLLDATTLEIEARLSGHRESVVTAAWNADSSRLATCSLDATLRIWNPSRPDAVPRVLRTGMSSVPLASFAPDGKTVLVTRETIRPLPVDADTVLRGHASFVYFLAFSPDGTRLASSGYLEHAVHLWDIRNATHLWTRPGPKNFRAGGDLDAASAVAFSADGRNLVAVGTGDTRHYAVADGAVLPVTSTHENPERRALEILGERSTVVTYTQFATSPKGDHRAQVSGDRVEIRNVSGADASSLLTPPDAPLVRELIGHEGMVYCVAYSPDGTRIASGGNDGTVRIWDASTGEQLLVLHGHTQYVKAVAFSPDGTMLASGSGDTTIRLWDTKPIVERRHAEAGAGDRP